MKSTYPLKKYGRCYGLTINNKRIVSDLMHRGVMPKTSNTLSWPKLPRSLSGHFIRGYFDGDGYTAVPEGKSKALRIGFCSGSIKFIEELRSRLAPKVSALTRRGTDTASIRIVVNSGSVFKIEYSGQDAASVCAYMYADAGSLYMRRKRVPYDDWLKAEAYRDRWTKAHVKFLRQNYSTTALAWLAAELKKSPDCVTRKARLLGLRKRGRRCTVCGNMGHVRTTCPKNANRKRKGQLRTAEVRRIRALASRGNVSQNEIARRFGVSPGLVSLIVNGKAWRQI